MKNVATTAFNVVSWAVILTVLSVVIAYTAEFLYNA
jgi:hypothetical protein